MSQAVPSADEARHRLYEIMKRDADFESKARAALELGTTYLGAEIGFVTRIEKEIDHWETIVSTDDSGGLVPEGMSTDIGGTYCQHTLERGSPFAVHDVPNQETALEATGFDCYHGTTITVDGEAYGTVCFVSQDPRTEPFSEAETMFAELVARLLEHELEHERQQDRLTRQMNMINVLDRVLRHNIRNELTIIRANARLHGQKHDDCRDCEAIVESADRLIGTSETARQLGKHINADAERRPVDLAALAREAVADARAAFPALSVTVDAPERLVVSVYPGLDTALWELLENAGEHAGPEPTVTLTVTEHDDSVELLVRDDGPGLPDTERDVLQTGAETDLVHGSGLGLWSVYWVVMDHAGDIDIETDDGTRVSLTIPKGKGERGPQIERAGDRYERAFERAGVGLALLDSGGTCTEANERAGELLGISPADLSGRPFEAFVTALSGPLGGEQITDGSGRCQCEEGDPLSYVLTTDIVPGQHLLVLTPA